MDIVVTMVVAFIKVEVMKKIIIDGKEKNEEKISGQHNIQENICNRCEISGYFWRECRISTLHVDSKKSRYSSYI